MCGDRATERCSNDEKSVYGTTLRIEQERPNEDGVVVESTCGRLTFVQCGSESVTLYDRKLKSRWYLLCGNLYTSVQASKVLGQQQSKLLLCSCITGCV